MLKGFHFVRVVRAPINRTQYTNTHTNAKWCRIANRQHVGATALNAGGCDLRKSTTAGLPLSERIGVFLLSQCFFSCVRRSQFSSRIRALKLLTLDRLCHLPVATIVAVTQIRRHPVCTNASKTPQHPPVAIRLTSSDFGWCATLLRKRVTTVGAKFTDPIRKLAYVIMIQNEQCIIIIT